MLGVAAGVLTGSILVMLWSIVGTTRFDEYWLRHALTVFTYAALVWAAGLILVAAVPWSLLHHYGLRGWPIAITLGIVLTFLVVFGVLTNGFGGYIPERDFSSADSGGPIWMNGRHTAHGWFVSFQFAAICSGLGGMVGLSVWRVAYRREVGKGTSRP